MQARAPPNSRSSPVNQALTFGFHAGFLRAAGFAPLAMVAAASIAPSNRSGLWRITPVSPEAVASVLPTAPPSMSRSSHTLTPRGIPCCLRTEAVGPGDARRRLGRTRSAAHSEAIARFRIHEEGAIWPDRFRPLRASGLDLLPGKAAARGGVLYRRRSRSGQCAWRALSDCSSAIGSARGGRILDPGASSSGSGWLHRGADHLGPFG